MSRLFYHTCQDNVGNLLFDVSGTMRIAGSGTLATIYGDEALTVILPNPMTNHPSFGSFKCFLGAGDYDFYLAKSGYTFETLTGVQGHGTMAQQDAHAVAITGGDARLSNLGLNTAVDALYQLACNGPILQTGGATRLQQLGINRAPASDARIHIDWPKDTNYGMILHQTGTDTSAYQTILFANVANTAVGSITTTGAATAFNTSSDARLKDAITPLAGALDVVRALRPISHRWKADDSPGVGFLAHEVAEIVDGVVTGEPDALDAEGNIQPMQIDLSKLVPYLVSACQALAEQVAALVGVAQDAHELTQALASRVAALEGARR